MSLEDRDAAQTPAMSDSEQESPGAREPACMLCRRAEADPDMCGEKLEKGGLCAHVFCMFFATLLPRQEMDRVGLMGFLPRDLLIAVRRAAQMYCCVCGQSGATIMCSVPECDRWFHLPCAKEGGCVNLYVTPFSSFCPEHRPEQEVEATPEPDTVCTICMEPVEDRKTFTTLVCPTCIRAWFHRDCIQVGALPSALGHQVLSSSSSSSSRASLTLPVFALQGQAMRAGLLCLRCPLCRDSEAFLVEMFILGIRIPFRQPTWEDNDAFAELGERHGQCNARDCLYPGGREEAEEEGPWQLLLCSSCAAEGTHRRCSGLRNSTDRWECDTCAGLGTSSRDESELNGPRLARQSGLGPSHGSPDLEAFSPSSHSRRPLESSGPKSTCDLEESALQEQQDKTKGWEAQAKGDTCMGIPWTQPLPPPRSGHKSTHPTKAWPWQEQQDKAKDGEAQAKGHVIEDAPQTQPLPPAAPGLDSNCAVQESPGQEQEDSSEC
ncbi:LOW QUALITY PROTEIN: PHD finger protein 7-like [Molothrus ater]|uniref:LOW QUALITY PROTEIN: PHD finger protein 7-like n=1 Tax=Molothrus ater TaxID=84834 RepID=UPI0023E762FB|nr:LOW QUALITY PROTEIN: PHD finger protein 7-like [Molothrus ater]